MSVSWYRDRHGRVRWRYRKGEICVQLPGKPGDDDFAHAVEQAQQGLIAQTPRPGSRPHPLRDLLVREFAREVLGKAKHRARGKRVPFSLTVDDVQKQMVDQSYRCALCGIPFLNVCRNEQAFRPSLDRIKPAEGYVPGNIRIVAFIVNLAMNKWGEEPLWRLAKLMIENLDSSPVERERVSNNLANPPSKALIY